MDTIEKIQFKEAKQLYNQAGEMFGKNQEYKLSVFEFILRRFLDL